MIYGHGNVEPRTQVHDVDAMERLIEVATINTDTGEVVMFVLPLTLSADGSELIMKSVHYTTIYPICGGGDKPCLFHCYGRIS